MRSTRRILKIMAGVALGLLMVSGCTRPKEETSKLKISIPQSMSSQKAGAQAFDQLAHLAINVTGDGISPAIFLSWDADHHNGTAASAPESFLLDIPQGSNRLIQVLAVYMDENNSSQMQFYYGDVTQNLSQASEVARVAVSSVGMGSSIISGRVSGRYFTSANAGPTGNVDMVFIPPGKPSMIIDRSFIVNGWFQFFGLIGAKFGYRLDDGTLLFGKSVDISAESFPASPSSVRVTLPPRKAKQWQRNTNTETWVSAEPEVYVYGFFGDAAGTASRKICRGSSPASTKNATSSSTDGSITLLNYSTAAPPTNIFQNGLTDFYVEGGIAASTEAQCLATANLFNDHLNFFPALLDNGNDNSAGFRMPFISTYSNGYASWITPATVNATTRSISGTLLPGVPDVMDKMVAFKKVGIEDVKSDSAPCYNLLNMGFTKAGEVAVTSTTFAMDLNLTATEIAQKVMVALCPMKGDRMAPRGSWLRGDMFGMSTGPVSNPPAMIDVRMQDNLAALNAGSCVPISVHLMGANSQPANYSAGTFNINFSTSTGADSFHGDNDPQCSNSPISSSTLTLSNGQTQQMVFMRVKGTPIGTGKTVVATATGLTGVTKTFEIKSAAAFAKIALVNLDMMSSTGLSTFGGSNTLIPGMCYPIILQLQDNAGAPVAPFSETAAASNSVGSLFTGANLYATSDRNCFGAATVTVNWANSGGTNYFANNMHNLKASTTVSFSVVTVINTSVPTGTIALATLPAASKLKLEVMGEKWSGSGVSIPRGVCLPIKITAVNSSSQVAAAGSSRNLTLSSTKTGTTLPTVEFSGSPACSTGGATIAAGISSGAVFSYSFVKVTGGSADSKVNLAVIDDTGSGTTLSAASWPQTSGSTGASLIDLKLLLSYTDPTDLNTRWVSLTSPSWASPAQMLTQCREMRVQVVDPSNNPVALPMPLDFQATHSAGATTGFTTSCPNTGGNSYSLPSGGHFGSIYFNPSYGSLPRGAYDLVVSSTGITTSEILSISVGLKFQAGLTAANVVAGSCQPNYTAKLMTFNAGNEILTPDTHLGPNFTAEAAIAPTGFSGGSVQTGPGHTDCSSPGPLTLSGSSPNFPFFIDTTSATGGAFGSANCSFSGADWSWANDNILFQ